MRSRFMRCRPFSARRVAILLLSLGTLAICYYYTSSHTTYNNQIGIANNIKVLFENSFKKDNAPLEECKVLRESAADIDTVTTYPNFDFQALWIRTKEFWDKNFEERYEKSLNDTRRPRLKVFVMPHSHNDPGWLKSFEQYFEWKTKNIITNMVHKLTQYPNMTFIWTEISFLNAWWERAHPVKQKALKKLIKEGRLEITSGGWVMPDEACTHIYSLIDQFIEGHSWVKNNLGVTPKTGWSIDPFGHGPTVPYLLDKSGLEGTLIQRIHYVWKQWLAETQNEDFHWLPGWDSNVNPKLIVHNLPYDIYSIKHSCGPHPAICLSYDFRSIPGEYSEYTSRHEEITDQNLHSKAKTLIEEYQRTGSLTPHNVVLMPLGDDFRYEYVEEFDAQFTNYMKMFNYINQNKETFNAEIQFGTPADYFKTVKQRLPSVPTLKGDFFVYSDIFSEGKPAYWSGYYTTRPYIKIIARQLEHQLRTSEILFTLVFNYARQNQISNSLSSQKKLEKQYEQLINSRRNLGLFQHHDAITGTSKAAVMYDYGTKLFTSLYHCIRLQELALSTVMIKDDSLRAQNVVQSEVEWESFGKPVKKLQISRVDRNTIILFNPLIEERTEVISLKSNESNFRVFDVVKKRFVPYQINPTIDLQEDGRHVLSDNAFEILFVANVPPLTAKTYKLEEYRDENTHSIVHCNNCDPSQYPEKTGKFIIKKMMAGDIQLENSVLKLLINRDTGFLKQVYRKDVRKRKVVDIQFGAYQSAQRHSGAYLFMPDYDTPEKPILNQYANQNGEQDEKIIIVSGPISTEVSTLYLPFLIHTVRIFNIDNTVLSHAIYIENDVDFGIPPTNRETELFMRIQTDIQNGEPPEFYTDQNGFQYQKRVKVNKLGIEANYYPITTMAWLQDQDTRLTLITNHAQGASAFEPGRLEVMLDRRTLYDDFRGLGEGIVDNKPTLFQNWLLLEPLTPESTKKDYTNTNTKEKRRFFNKNKSVYQVPTPMANILSRSLNYPLNVYIVDKSEVSKDVEVLAQRSFVRGFPSGLHLMTLRTITDDILEQFPSAGCLMVLQRVGERCGRPSQTAFTPYSHFTDLRIQNISMMSLTGLNYITNLTGLDQIKLEQMDIKTFKIYFK